MSVDVLDNPLLCCRCAWDKRCLFRCDGRGLFVQPFTVQPFTVLPPPYTASLLPVLVHWAWAFWATISCATPRRLG